MAYTSLKAWQAEFFELLALEWRVKSVNLPLAGWFNAGLTPQEGVAALKALIANGAALQPLKALAVEHFYDRGCHLTVSRLPSDAELALLQMYLSGHGACTAVLGLFLPDDDRFTATYKCCLL